MIESSPLSKIIGHKQYGCFSTHILAPGVISTSMWDHVDALFVPSESLPFGTKRIQVGAVVPLGYMGDPTDFAGAVVFLASDDASCITAQTLEVDGGNVMS